MGPVVLASGAAHAAPFAILPALVLTPLLGAVLLVAIPARRAELHRLVALLSASITGALAVWVLAAFETGEAGFQFVDRTPWISSLDINFSVGVDGISLFMVVLTGVLFPLALLCSHPDHDTKGYYAWLTLLEVGCMGAFVTLDLFVFFLCFELTLIPLYFLIGKWGHGRRIYAANKFFLYTMAGSAFMLVSIVTLAVASKAGVDGGPSFDLLKVAASDEISQGLGRLLFAGFAIAFMVKVPVFPFHTWLPDAHTQAPTAGSVDLAGVLLKLGTYGFIRYGVFLFPEAAVWFAPALVTLGTIGIVYGGVVAAMQKNLKRLVAYSSVAHMGFVVVGVFVLNTHGLVGGIAQMINHGLITGGLFMMLGFLYERRHTYEIAELRGLQKVAPVFAGVFTVLMLASVGMPGLAGFVGEFLVLLGAFVAHRWWAMVAATGVIVAALYLLWAYQRTFHGEPDEANAGFAELRVRELAPVLPLLALTVFLGLYPRPVLERIEPSVAALIDHVEAHVPGFVEPTSQRGSELVEPSGSGHTDGQGSEPGGIVEVAP